MPRAARPTLVFPPLCARVVSALLVCAGCAPATTARDPRPHDEAPPPPLAPPLAPPLDGPACDAHRATLDTLTAALDDERRALGIPGAAIAIVIDNCLSARGVGEAARGGPAADARTRFQLASLTKTMTAMTAIALEEEGVIARTERVDSVVSTRSTATLEQLLAHRAGFPTDLSASASLDLATWLDDNADAPMWAPPGEVWLYSNPGYGLAGRVLEVAAGMPFEELVRTRIFEPAGMDDALMGATLVGDEERMALGHSGAPQAPDVIDPTDLYLASTYYGPMGGAFVSAADVARWMHAFFTDAVLSEQALDDMSTSRGEAYGASVGYGQGLFVAHDGRAFHGGSVAGFLSEMHVHRAARAGVAVLANADWAFPWGTLASAQDALFPAAGPPPTSHAPDEDEIIGRYQDDVELGAIEVARVDGALTLTLDGEALALTPWWPGTWGFFYAPWGVEIDVSFQRGPSGALYAVTLIGVAAKL